MAAEARATAGIQTVVLCGGVFLNRKLTEAASAALTRAGFRVVRPIQYSPNDESLSVGQIAFALARLKK